MKRHRLFPLCLFLLALCLLFTGCGPVFEDPDKQADYENLRAVIAQKDWLHVDEALRQNSLFEETTVKNLVCDTLCRLHTQDEPSAAAALLLAMPPDYADGTDYFADEDFCLWLAEAFHQHCEPLSTASDSAAEAGDNMLEVYDNYDENAGLTYSSRVFVQGDFLLNTYTVYETATGRPTEPIALDYYIGDMCIYSTSEETELPGEALLRRFIENGVFYVQNGTVCYTLTGDFSAGFFLADEIGRFCEVHTAIGDKSGHQIR